MGGCEVAGRGGCEEGCEADEAACEVLVPRRCWTDAVI